MADLRTEKEHREEQEVVDRICSLFDEWFDVTRPYTVSLRNSRILHFRCMEMYVRRQIYVIPNDAMLKIGVRQDHEYAARSIVDAVVVARVEIGDKYKGRGIFSRIMDHIEKSPTTVSVVESVLNRRLAKHLARKRGYTPAYWRYIDGADDYVLPLHN